MNLNNEIQTLTQLATRVKPIWQEHNSQKIPNLPSRILITGCSGYVGKWIMGSLLALSELKPDLHFEIYGTVSSGRSTFLERDNLKISTLPWNPLFEENLELENLTHIFHLANYNKLDNYDLLNPVFASKAATYISNFTARSDNSPKVIYASSGAVYGNKTKSPIKENSEFSKEVTPYGYGKRSAESILFENANRFDFKLVAARLFSFFGPELPRNGNFFMGQLMESALTGRDFRMLSDGSIYRSYMHGSELGFRMLQIGFSDFTGAINIGGSNAIKLRDLASIFSSTFDVKISLVDKFNGSDNDYYPDTSVLRNKFGNVKSASLEVNLIDWYEYEMSRMNLR